MGWRGVAISLDWRALLFSGIRRVASGAHEKKTRLLELDQGQQQSRCACSRQLSPNSPVGAAAERLNSPSVGGPSLPRGPTCRSLAFDGGAYEAACNLAGHALNARRRPTYRCKGKNGDINDSTHHYL